MQGKILVTGAAGFIGFHLSSRLLGAGRRVVGLDNLNDYYSPALKRDRLARLVPHDNFTFHEGDLADRAGLEALFAEHRPRLVVNLAAQAGVRYSLSNPYIYIESNINGFVNILECCRHGGVEHLVYASSSSVYGLNKRMPFSIHHNVDHPVSLYAASKKSNELMAHTYSHLFGLRTTGLRFFTVYGPWGRPDMALFIFTRAILENKPIELFNNGDMRRDFTYIDDIIEGVVRIIDHPAEPNPAWDALNPDPGSSLAPYRLYNIGNSNKVDLRRFVEIIEEVLGKKADKIYLPMQPGDAQETWADVDDLTKAVGFRPNTSLEDGIPRFIDWYREYYRL